MIKMKKLWFLLWILAVRASPEELYPLAPSTVSSQLINQESSSPGFSTEFTGSTEIHSSFSSGVSSSSYESSSLASSSGEEILGESSSSLPSIVILSSSSSPPSNSFSQTPSPTKMSTITNPSFEHSSSSTNKPADHFLGVKAPRMHVEPSKPALGPYTQEEILNHLSVETSPLQGEARQAPDVTNILKGLLNVVGEGLSIATNFVKEENKRKKLVSSSSQASIIQGPIQEHIRNPADVNRRPTRPPRPSRINNRGPPRLTEIPFESIPLEVLSKPKPGQEPQVQIPQRPFKYGPPLIGGTSNQFPGGVPLPQLLIPQLGNVNNDIKKKKKVKVKTKISQNLIRPTRIPIGHLQHTYTPALSEEEDEDTVIEESEDQTTTTNAPSTTTASSTTSQSPEESTSSTTQKTITKSTTTETTTTTALHTSDKTPPLPPLTFVPSVHTTKPPAIIKSKLTPRPNQNRPTQHEQKIPLQQGPIESPEPIVVSQSPQTEPDIINLTLTADQNFGVPYQNLKPDILTYTPGQQEQFVNINGQKTYFDIGGAPTEVVGHIYPSRPTILPPSVPVTTSRIDNIGSAEVVSQEELHRFSPPPVVPDQRPLKTGPTRRPNAPPIRIDTCIVGDEGTCDKDRHEICKVFLGVSSCFCKPGYGRRNHRHPCKKTVRLLMSLQVDRINDRKLFWSNQYRNPNSEEYQLLEGESNYAVDTSMALTSFSSSYIGNSVNRFFALNGKVTVNLTLELFQNPYTTSPIIKRDIQRKLIQVIQARESNIGNGNLYVDGPLNPVPGVADLDECSEPEMNDCNERAKCINKFGTFTCVCDKGYGDPFEEDEDLMGRYCQSCSADNCSGRGDCSLEDGVKVCTCKGNYYGKSCEIDGDVLVVAIGASVAAVVIIVLTLFCLCLWSRKWRQEEEKGLAASGIYASPTYSSGNQVNNSIYQQPTLNHQIISPYPRRLPPPPPPSTGPPPPIHSVDLSERLRWMHEVLNQQNAYAQLHPQQAPPTPSQFTANGLYSVPVNSGSNNTFIQEDPIYGTLPRIYNEPRKQQRRRSQLMRRSSSDERISELQFRRGFVIPEDEEEETTSFGSSSESVYHVRPRDRPSRPMSHVDAAKYRSGGIFGLRKK